MRRIQSDGVLKARDVVALPGLVVDRVGDPCWAGDDRAGAGLCTAMWSFTHLPGTCWAQLRLLQGVHPQGVTQLAGLCWASRVTTSLIWVFFTAASYALP